jgi:hypothetical protein
LDIRNEEGWRNIKELDERQEMDVSSELAAAMTRPALKHVQFVLLNKAIFSMNATMA